MALPYPEGEVFFKRSVLERNGNSFNPDNLGSFNSHALIEWCWNETPRGGTYSRAHVKHQLGKYSDKEEFGFYDSMIVMFGTKEGFEKKVGKGTTDTRHDSRHSGIARMVKTKLPDDTEEYEKRKKGGPLMTAVTPIKLDPGQPYMYIDLIFPIRAIYFPLAQKPSSVFPDLCSYLMVDFRMRQGVKMWDEPPSREALLDLTPEQKRAQEESIKHLPPPIREAIANQGKPEGKSMKFDLYAGLGVHPSCESVNPLISIISDLFFPK
jgi:hypothetical protein